MRTKRIFLLLVIFYSNLFAYTCYSRYCQDDRIGIGAHYSTLTSPLSEIQSKGAYLSIYSGYHWSRLYYAIDVLLGFIQPSIKIDSNQHTDNSYYLFASAAMPHIGLKFGTKERLFLLYLAPNVEVYNFGQDDKNGKFTAAYISIGPHIKNRTFINEKIALETELGVAANAVRRYMGESFEDKSKAFDGSYRLNASLGIYFQRNDEYSKKTDFYIRLNAVYYNNKAYNHTNIRQPAANDYTLMLECGMTLENLFR